MGTCVEIIGSGNGLSDEVEGEKRRITKQIEKIRMYASNERWKQVQ
jgi:hypothetical protein